MACSATAVNYTTIALSVNLDKFQISHYATLSSDYQYGSLLPYSHFAPSKAFLQMQAIQGKKDGRPNIGQISLKSPDFSVLPSDGLSPTIVRISSLYYVPTMPSFLFGCVQTTAQPVFGYVKFSLPSLTPVSWTMNDTSFWYCRNAQITPGRYQLCSVDFGPMLSLYNFTDSAVINQSISFIDSVTYEGGNYPQGMACGEKSFFLVTTPQSVSQVLLSQNGGNPVLVKGETGQFLNKSSSSFEISSTSVFSTQWSTSSDQVAFPLVNWTGITTLNCGVLLLDYDLSV